MPETPKSFKGIGSDHHSGCSEHAKRVKKILSRALDKALVILMITRLYFLLYDFIVTLLLAYSHFPKIVFLSLIPILVR